MRIVVAVAICLAGMVTFSGCKKEANNLYLHNKQDANQTAFADEVKTSGFTFTSKNNWMITVKATGNQKNNDVSWLKLFYNEIETYSGNGGTFMMDVLLEINYSGEIRMATIEIVSGNDMITITVTQSGKNKDGEVPEPEPFVIDLTDAILGDPMWSDVEIATLKVFSVRCDSGVCVEYLLVSTEVAQTGYKITLPNPEKALVPFFEINTPGLKMSDPNTKFVSVFCVSSYDKKGKQNGQFMLRSGFDVWLGIYIYCDRDCNITGKSETDPPIYADCYFKKGWNLYYQGGEYRDDKWINVWTTEKPIGENFKWSSWLLLK